VKTESCQIARRLGAMIAALILTACVSTPSRPPSGKKAGAPPTARSSGKATSPATPRGGGYYKDDGPGSSPPPGLEKIPDAAPRTEPLIARLNRPYKALGKTYTPHTRLEPFRQRGVASWYGRRFHGRRTASGEPYDMYAMSAAHPTLPIPSYARVTRRSNGQSVVVRINDRGPFLHGRIIDLSYAAALKLGYIDKGSAEVEVEQLLPDAPDGGAPPAPEPRRVSQPLPAPPAQPDDDPISAVAATIMAVDVTASVENSVTHVTQSEQNMYLQLGVFASRENAEEFRIRAETQVGRLELAAENEHFRLYAGPYASLAAADAAARRIGALLNIRPFIVRR
jgi:rare lipoprotein A